jgi:hypothetical protein
MSLAVEIGVAVLFLALVFALSRASYLYGVQCGQQSERLLADQRVRGVLAGEKKSPRQRPKAKSPKMIKVGEVSVPALIVKTSKKG